MEKPVSVARRDYINTIVNATNASGLPAFVIVDALEGILREAKQLAEQEYKRDVATYRAALSKGANANANT